VVGAGLTGLAAAHELRRAGVACFVFETEARAGGIVTSDRAGDGSLIEGGPDGFLASDPEIPELAEALGIGADIVRQAVRGSFVWDGAQLSPLAEGSAATMLGIDVRAEDLAAGHASFAGGMGQLVGALAREIAPDLRLGLAIIGIAPAPEGVRLLTADGGDLEAAAVILAVPGYRASLLARAASPEAAEHLRAIRYAPSLAVTLGYAAHQVGRALEGTGFVVAEDARIPLRACTYASRKFAGRGVAGRVTLRAFLQPGTAAPAGTAHQLLLEILSIVGDPEWDRVYEWPRGIPQYAAGHADRIAEIRRALAPARIFVAGAACDGPGVSACVRSGRAAARDVMRALAARRSSN
jgi:oxygen-dependent protoporphyrinogen oxidase